MAPTLPADSAKELMDSIHSILDDWEAVLALADELQRISTELRELHPDARARQRTSDVTRSDTERDSRRASGRRVGD